MPKCEIDLALQEQLRLFQSENRLSVSGAAEKLGVERSTLWRFCNSGRARDDTRAVYREALAKFSSNAAADVADVADVAVNVDAGQPRRVLQASFADSELGLIRRTCETVLALLDAYEARASGRQI